MAATPACAPIDHCLLIRPIWLHVVVTLLHRIFRHPLYLSDFPEITRAATGGIIRRWEERDGFDIGVHAGIKQVVGSILVFARIYLIPTTRCGTLYIFDVLYTITDIDTVYSQVGTLRLHAFRVPTARFHASLASTSAIVADTVGKSLIRIFVT